MKTAIMVIGMVVGGSALFIGSSLAILSFQGRLEGEDLVFLNKNPVLKAFLPAPDPAILKKDAGGDGAGKEAESSESEQGGGGGGRSRNKPGTQDRFNKSSGALPEGFSINEFMDLMDEARETREKTEKQKAALEVEKGGLGRLRDDLAERKTELEKIMTSIATAKSELDAAREEFRREVVTIEENEEVMIRKLAEIFSSMKSDEAAKQFDEMDIQQAVKIMVKMDAADAGKILPSMDASKVRELTEKLAKFQEQKKKSDTGK